jgi:hypothetical protein
MGSTRYTTLDLDRLIISASGRPYKDDLDPAQKHEDKRDLTLGVALVEMIGTQPFERVDSKSDHHTLDYVKKCWRIVDKLRDALKVEPVADGPGRPPYRIDEADLTTIVDVISKRKTWTPSLDGQIATFLEEAQKRLKEDGP